MSNDTPKAQEMCRAVQCTNFALHTCDDCGLGFCDKHIHHVDDPDTLCDDCFDLEQERYE